MLKIKILLVCVIVLIFASITEAQNTKLGTCTVSSSVNIKYKLGVWVRPVSETKTLFLQISIKPENFNKEFLIKLAERIKNEYCNEQKLSVVIFDNHKFAKDFSAFDEMFDSNNRNVKVREIYDLDRITNKESIIFSSEIGKPINEIEIIL